MDTLSEISLFSGYGGISLGLRLAGLNVKTIGYVENDEYCQQILRSRIRDGYLDWAPIVRDIRTADFRPMAGLVDLVTAGFPCQPHSVAGQRRGEADERNLWPDTLRVIREVGPRFVLLENVPGILADPGYAGTVVGELAGAGYDCVWGCVPAAAVGAPHLRWRWWCLAWAGGDRYVGYTNQQSAKLESQNRVELSTFASSSGQDGDMADAEGEPRVLRSAAGERPGRLTGGGDNLANAEAQPSGHGQLRNGQAFRNGQAQEGYQVRSDKWWAVEPPLC